MSVLNYRLAFSLFWLQYRGRANTERCTERVLAVLCWGLG